MKIANRESKKLIIEILSNAFEDNKSINYIVNQDKNKVKRIRNLIEYSFEICFLFGKVLLSEDEKSCALFFDPKNKKTTIQSMWLDIKLIFRCVGLKNAKKVLAREILIKRTQPKEAKIYLWFIGTDPDYQSRGNGSALLKDILQLADQQNKAVYLETSTLKNIPWYKKFDFEVYAEKELNYRLFFLRRRINKK